VADFRSWVGVSYCIDPGVWVQRHIPSAVSSRDLISSTVFDSQRFCIRFISFYAESHTSTVFH